MSATAVEVICTGQELLERAEALARLIEQRVCTAVAAPGTQHNLDRMQGEAEKTRGRDPHRFCSAREATPAARTRTALSIRSTAEMDTVLGAVLAAMAAHGFPECDAFAVRLALEEALVNAIKHGHGGNLSKQVRVCYEVTAEEVNIEVVDQGPGFVPQEVPDPLAPENWEKPSGRGLLLMRRYLTSIQYNERGNAVTLRKQRSHP